MAKKGTAALLAQTRPLVNENSVSIADSSPKVKMNILTEIRLEKNLPVADMVNAVKPLYPRYDNTLHSKVEHGSETGVKLRDDALKAILLRFAPERLRERVKDHRSKANRIQARLSDDLYARLQEAVKASNLTTQDFIEKLVIDYVSQH